MKNTKTFRITLKYCKKTNNLTNRQTNKLTGRKIGVITGVILTPRSNQPTAPPSSTGTDAKLLRIIS